MLKKTITYTDYNGVEKTEDFYFNLTKSELIDLELDRKGGLQASLTKAINSKDAPTLAKTFRMFVLAAYGEKDPDGRFVKSPEISRRFTQTAAYDDFYMSMLSDSTGKSMIDFITAIMPADLVQQANQTDLKQQVAGALNVVSDA